MLERAITYKFNEPSILYTDYSGQTPCWKKNDREDLRLLAEVSAG